MSEGVKLSQYDPNQIVRMGFDDDQRAQRVILIGGEMPEIKMGSPQSVRIERIEVPTIIKEIDIREVKVASQIIVQKEIQIERIEVPQIIIQKELQIERVEIPIIVKEFVEIIKEIPIVQHEVKFIEKEVYVDRIVQKDLPKWIKFALVTQVMVSILMMSLNIWSKLK